MNEQEVIARVELRLLMANDDSAFSKSLSLYLVPLIQKLVTPHTDIVRRILDVLAHVSRRIDTSEKVELPTDKLYDLFYSKAGSHELNELRVLTQCLTFFGKALYRTPSPRNYVSGLVHGLVIRREATDFEKYAVAEQFSLFLWALRDWVRQEDLKPLALRDDERHFVVRYLTRFIMFDPAHYPPEAHPGMSKDDVSFFIPACSKVGLMLPRPDEREFAETRRAVVKLSTIEGWFLPLVAAAADRVHDIARVGISESLRMAPDWSTTQLHQLVALSMGANGARGASLELKAVILECLARAHASLDLLNPLIEHAFESGKEILRAPALSFLLHCDLGKNSDRFVGPIHQYIIDGGWPTHVATQPRRSQAYQVLGRLIANSTNQDISMINFLFRSLEQDSVEYAPAIQHALTEILQSCGTSTATVGLARNLMYYMLTADADRTKLVVVKWAVRTLPFDAADGRLICLLGLDRTRSDVIDEASRGLNPYSFSLLNTNADSSHIMFPQFLQMLRAIKSQWEIFTPITRDAAIRFLWGCLVPMPHTDNWKTSVETAVRYDPKIRHDLVENMGEHADEVAELCYSVINSTTEYFDAPVETWRLLLEHRKIPAVPEDLSSILENPVYARIGAETLAVLSPGCETVIPTGPGSALALAWAGSEMTGLVEYCVENRLTDALIAMGFGGRLPKTPEVEGILKTPIGIAALAMSCPDLRHNYLDSLLNHTEKSFDSLVATGEAISVIVSGWDSKWLQLNYSLLVSSREVSQSADLALVALKKISEAIRGSPVQRRLASVWLLCLIQYSSSILPLQSVQNGLMALLADQDEVTQESAARALAALYDSGSSGQKQSLVDSLVAGITGQGASAKTQTVTESTQLFPPGMLSTGDGSVSTYKDVLSLASEVGDTSLVYKFMALASNSALWSGRRGMAFSLNAILSRAELPAETQSRLIPKLFRFLHDPSENARRAMTQIWLALVKEPRLAITENLSAILAELFAGVVDREWRTRQASAAGLAELVISQPYDSMEPYQERLWELAVRSVDDIKESVRGAGTELTQALASSIVRRLEGSKPVNLEVVISFLLGTKGLQSQADEVREFSLTTLTKIIRSCSDSFEPYALRVLEELGYSLSSLEPQAMNYLALHASDAVDASRAATLTSSPVMDSLQSIVERLPIHLMTTLIEEVLPRLVKQAVGVPSNLAAARLTILACLRYTESPSFSSLMQACLSRLQNHNATVAQAYAGAIGYVSRHCSVSDNAKLGEKIRTLYLTEEGPHLAAALAAKSVANVATDQYYAEGIIPLAAVGRFDEDDAVAQGWNDVWSSSPGALRLFRDEIVSLTLPLLTVSSYATRRAAARAISDVASLKSDFTLLTGLAAALDGRAWSGKHLVFHAFSLAAIATETEESSPVVLPRALSEIRRRRIEYKLLILPDVGSILSDYHNEELAVEFFSQASELLDDETVAEDSKVQLLSSAENIKNYEQRSASLIRFPTWQLRVASCNLLAALGRRNFFSQQCWKDICTYCAQDNGHEIVRLAWARCAVTLKPFDGVSQEAYQLARNEVSSQVKEELTKL